MTSKVSLGTKRRATMSAWRNYSLDLIDSYADVSSSNRDNLRELRRLAALDQEHARVETDWFLAVQDWMLAANACFHLQFRYSEILKNIWYQQDGAYDLELEDKLTEGFHALVEDSDQLLADIAALRVRGRPLEGAEVYEAYVLQAREVLENDAIRRQAERLMPSLEKLDALCDAHRRSAAP